MIVTLIACSTTTIANSGNAQQTQCRYFLTNYHMYVVEQKNKRMWSGKISDSESEFLCGKIM